MHRRAGIGFSIALAVTLTACPAGTDAPDRAAPAADAPPPAAAPVETAGALPPGVTMEMVQQGQQLYGTVCVACHGPGGTGTPLGPALNDDRWINIPGDYESIVNVIRTGVMQPREHPAQMPPMGGGNFNEEQLRALGAFVYSLSHR